MRHRSSRESSPPLPPKPLHDVLQTALGSLDVQLEEELSRYRRTRQKKTAKSANRRSHNRAPKPLDTIYVEAKGGRTQSAAAGAIALTGASKLPSPVPPPPPSKMKSNKAATSSTQLAIAADAAPIPTVESSNLMPSTTDAETAQKLANPDDLGLGPDDYLESSEELLKSLEDQDSQEQEPSFVQSLLTPLGIGSMLLLLLSSVTLGYLIMNPASLGILSEGERGDRPSEASGEVALGSASDGSAHGTIPGSPDLATEEFRELNLGTLSTLPTGKTPVPGQSASPEVAASPATSNPTQLPTVSLPDPSSTPTLSSPTTPATASLRPNGQSAPAQAPAPTPAPASAPANPAVRSSAPAPVRPGSTASPAQVNAARTTQPPSVQPASPPAATAPAPASAAASPPASGQDDYYYVTTPYNGDRSLEQARQAVGDAYVRNLPNGGAQVQVGAFRDRAGAEELANELEQQGISAEVHQP
jgi:hypothetical protein